MYFEPTHPSPATPPRLPHRVFLPTFITHNTISAVCVCRDVGTPIGTWVTYQGPHP